MNIQEEKQVTIHINGCTVTVPASQEQIYREALADKWIDGCRVYVENGEVKYTLSSDKKTNGLKTDLAKKILIEANHKKYALNARFISDN